MNETLQKIKEWETKAQKYDELKETFNKKLLEIRELTNRINVILGDIDPTIKISRSGSRKYGITIKRTNEIYNLLKESDTQISAHSIANKYEFISESASYLIINKLIKMEGIQRRREGRNVYYYYFKPKINKDDVEISPEIKIPKEFSFKS